MLYEVITIALRRHHLSTIGAVFDRWIPGLIPRVLAISMGAGGRNLMVFSSLPTPFGKTGEFLQSGQVRIAGGQGARVESYNFV